MNLEQEYQEQGFNVQLEVSGVELQVQSTGAKFVGIIEPAPPIDPDFALGSDLREKSLLHVLQENDPGLQLFDRLSPTAPAEEPTSEEAATTEPDGDESPAVWKVIKIEVNPADIVNKYWLERVVPGKDS